MKNKILKISITLCIISLVFSSAFAQPNAQTKKVLGEPKEEMQARLKANVIKETNGDVHITPFKKVGEVPPLSGFPHHILGCLKYYDSQLDEEFLFEKFPKAGPSWIAKSPYIEEYFASKKVNFEPISRFSMKVAQYSYSALQQMKLWKHSFYFTEN